jgi:heme-degrading monooxygenase HmoA
MAQPGIHPPQGEAGRLMGSLPGARFTEGVTFAVDGTEAAGPESAQAVLVLQGTLAGEGPAELFWTSAAHTLRAAMDSPGFIRFIGFSDGLSNYALGFWSSLEAAQAFARGRQHREAVKDLYRTGSQYSHFAGLYKAASVSSRHFFCDRCGAATAAPAAAWEACGNPFVDVFESHVRPRAGDQVEEEATS